MNPLSRYLGLYAVAVYVALHSPHLWAADSGSISSTGIVRLVVAGEPRCAIVAAQEDALSKRTVSRLVGHLREQTGANLPILSGADLAADTHESLIVLDGTADHRLLSKLAITISVPEDRADAYHLKVIHQEKRTVVAVAGHSPTGAKFGAYRLMEEMELSPGSAAVSDLDLAVSPFFKTRSVSLFNVWRVPVEVIRQCNLESWPAEKIQQAVDAYDVLGFNAIETHDRFHEDFLKAVYGLTREQWRAKVYALCDRAHEDGMTVFLRLWGNSVALPVKELEGGYTPFGYVNLAPDIPEERQRWETEIRDYASKTYAAHIDHLIGHWADAGGVHPGSHATIKDAMLLHNELRAAFRAINPKIETSFNLWNMANPKGRRGWPGYVDHRTITTAGVLAKDVIIAQATRAKSHAYSEKVTQDILSDGYRAAVWTWRRGDTEVRLSDPGLRIRIHGIMSDYFHGLPASASQLEWHNIERNQHGLANDVNYYIASKLMWDPKADVDAALNKYCALVFGKANAAAVAEAFLTIEASRDPEMGISKNILAHPAAGATRARRALEAMEDIRLPEGHRPRLPSVTSPQEMLDELHGTLAVIAENADLCVKQLPAIDALLQQGKSEEAKARAAELQKKADAWFGTITGGVEGLWLKEALQARFEAAAREESKELGSRTSNVAPLEQKNPPIVAPRRAKKAAVRTDTRPAPLGSGLPGIQVLRDVEYIKGGHERNRLDLYLPEKAARPMPVIVWIHGGGWQAGDKAGCPPAILQLATKGYAVVPINYRFSQDAVFPAQIHDCKAAIRWLRANAGTYGLDPNHIGVGGGSAGGHLVALLGTTADVKELDGPGGNEDQSSRVQAVLEWYGPSNFLTAGPKETRTRLIGADPLKNPEKAAQASPVTYVSKNAAPFLIMHGDKDKTVPISQSETLAEALKKAGADATFITVKGAGHGGRLFTSPENMKRIEEFFRRHLTER